MTFNDKLKSVGELPLFMSDLSTAETKEAGRRKGEAVDIEGNPVLEALSLEALQELAFEGTSDEIAENLKAQGNDHFKGKRYQEAIVFYTHAIEAKPTDSAILQACYLNRAAGNLELGNYGQSIKDTSQVLALNPNSEKAYWRAARALFATDKLIEALDCCDRGLKVNPESKEFSTLKVKIEKGRVVAEKTERERRERETDLALERAFQVRGLVIDDSPELAEVPRPVFVPEAAPHYRWNDIPLSGPKASTWQAPDPNTLIIFPVFLIYMEHRQMDLVVFSEDDPVGAYLDKLFPGPGSSKPQKPWDINGKYYTPNLNVYAKTHKQRILKVDRRMTLREVMDQCANNSEEDAERDGLVLANGAPSLVVLPKGSAAEKRWIDRVKWGKGKPYKSWSQQDATTIVGYPL